MATEHVDQDKQPEQSEVSSSSGWNVTTSRMVIEFYKENRVLWDRNHKDYGKNSIQKKLFTPLVAKLKRSNVPKSEAEIKKRWHNLRTSEFKIRLRAQNKYLVAATCRTCSADEASCRSDGATCRRDVSQRFVASCVSAFSFSYRVIEF